jgi:hypothetical protein
MQPTTQPSWLLRLRIVEFTTLSVLVLCNIGCSHVVHLTPDACFRGTHQWLQQAHIANTMQQMLFCATSAAHHAAQLAAAAAHCGVPNIELLLCCALGH